jgi:hypothetical protein
MTEKALQKQVLDYLKLRGVFHWRNNTGRRGMVSYGQKGSPDICCVLPSGHFVGFEIKSKGGALSLEQIEWHDDLEKYTHDKSFVVVMRPGSDYMKQIDELLAWGSK